jgi:inner membrane protein
MASFAHVAFGLAGGRALEQSRPAPWRAMGVLTALSLLPDADVLGFRFAIPYSSPFGHRGATHSLVFAALAGVATAGILSRGGRWSFWRAAATCLVVAVSHTLLDSLTDGGRGVALLWPFSNTRYFAPWRPLPVAPIGAGMLSARGLYVVAFESVATLPLLLWTLWPRRNGAS